MAAPDWPNGFYAEWYPETVPLWTGPKGGDGRVPYSKDWLEYLRDLQPNKAAVEWITQISAGLFNADGNEYIPIFDLGRLGDPPVAEGISTGGNVVKVLETKNGSARIEMLYLRNGPPKLTKINYQSTPWLVTKFTSISLSGELGNANGNDVYFPNVAKQKDGYWVDMQRLEMFPQLPVTVTAIQSVDVLNAPASLAKQIQELPVGQTLTVQEYLPQGSDVWGCSDQGWVLLEYLDKAGQPVYATNWNMQTRPPILFP